VSQSMQFERLMNKTHLAYHQDGLLDLLIAWILFTFGVGEATHYTFRWLPLFLLPVILYWPIKRWLSIPRFGYVEFLSNRSQELLLRVVYPLAWLIGVPVILLTLIPMQQFNILWLTSVQHWLQASWTPIIGLAVVISLGLLGWSMKIPRLYAYGVLCLLIVLGSQLLRLPTFVLFAALTVVILIVGVVLLIRFLRNYPLMIEGK